MNLTELVEKSYAMAKSKGFHDNPEVTFGDRIALIHSEVSEALEAFRSCGLEGVKCNFPRTEGQKPEGVPSELADVVIRVADLCGRYGIDLDAAITEKMAYNATRPYRHGGQEALMHVAIVGSRDCNHEYVRKVLKELLGRISVQSVLISGGAEGVDSLVEEVAAQTGHHVAVIKPLWDKYKDRAGLVRNSAIAQIGDLFIVLYNPKSDTKGCLDTGAKAEKLGRLVWYVEIQ